MHAYLVMTVDSGLYLAVENEDHELVLQVGDGSIEAGSHQSQISRQVRAEKYKSSDMECQVGMHVMSSVLPKVLYESPVPDHGVQRLDVVRQIHVEHQVVPDLLQHL